MSSCCLGLLPLSLASCPLPLPPGSWLLALLQLLLSSCHLLVTPSLPLHPSLCSLQQDSLTCALQAASFLSYLASCFAALLLLLASCSRRMRDSCILTSWTLLTSFLPLLLLLQVGIYSCSCSFFYFYSR